MNLLLLKQIKDGKSLVSNFWIKHPTINDEVYLEFLNKKYLDLALKRKMPLEKEAIFLANKLKTWTDSDEMDLVSSESYLDRLKINYEKVIDAQKKYLENDINSVSLKVLNLRNKKETALGKTAEYWSFKLASERYILYLFYKDENLLKRAWSEEDAEMLSQEEVNRAFLTFNLHKKELEEEKLKELACSPFCQNLYSLVTSPVAFFGNNIFDLTCIQQRFLLLLEYYKNIVLNMSGKVPNKTLSDWKELEKWARGSDKNREEMEKSWNSSSGKDNKINFEAIKRASSTSQDKSENKLITEMLT